MPSSHQNDWAPVREVTVTNIGGLTGGREETSRVMKVDDTYPRAFSAVEDASVQYQGKSKRPGSCLRRETL